MSSYQHRSRRQRRRTAAVRRGRTREHPRVQRRSRTTRRAHTKGKRIPSWHPAGGNYYRYPGHHPGRWTRDSDR